MKTITETLLFLATIASALLGAGILYHGLRFDIAIGTAIGAFILVMSIFVYIQLMIINLRDEILNNVGKRVIHEMVKDPEGENDDGHR